MSAAAGWAITIICALSLALGLTMLINPRWVPSDTLRGLRGRWQALRYRAWLTRYRRKWRRRT